MSRRTKIVSLGLLGLAGLLAMVLLAARPAALDSEAYASPDGEALTIADAQREFWRLTPALLLVVYEAFSETQEDGIYDTLARVTHGDALEYLYLERVGAMAGGGLEESDQTIHEIKLLNTTVTRQDQSLVFDASWQVIGTVGHAEHMHVRGNTYSADLTVAPIDGAWRITDFELLDVSRDAAGETFPAPQDDS
ncbi:MAG: hypothetical protein AAFY73_15645 [Pseudomonadota bacterium]